MFWGRREEGKCSEDRSAYTSGYMIDMKIGKGKRSSASKAKREKKKEEVKCSRKADGFSGTELD